MNLFKSIFATFITLSLGACQSTGLFIANIPYVWGDHTIASDISYGNQPWQKLDIYRPSDDAPSYQVIVFFYGGGWTGGSKESYKFLADELTNQGYMVVIPDYVKYPKARHPAYVEDAAKASKWVIDHIANYKGSPTNLYLMGHSAGAHIAATLLARKEFLAKEGLSPIIYKSFVGLAGPYNFRPGEKPYTEIFGPPTDYDKLKVSNYIDGTEPPMLLLHGDDDDTVNKRNMETLANTIHSKGGKVQTRLYPGVSHLTILGAFSKLYPLNQQITEDIIQYFSTGTLSPDP